MTGEVAELERFNALMSKRGEQVRGHLDRLRAEWEAAHLGESIGSVFAARLAAKAWVYERPAKKPPRSGKKTLGAERRGVWWCRADPEPEPGRWVIDVINRRLIDLNYHSSMPPNWVEIVAETIDRI